MRPYNVELFDRNLDFICSTTIDPNNFQYSFDALNPTANTVSVRSGIIPSPSNPNTVQSWYIRITRPGENYQGLIKSIAREEKADVVRYVPLVYLFNDNVRVKTKDIVEMASTDDYIRDVIKANFVNNSDQKRNVPHLTVVSLGNASAAYSEEYTYTESLADWKTRMELENGLSGGQWDDEDAPVYYYVKWEYDHTEPGDDESPPYEVWTWHVYFQGNYNATTTTTLSSGGLAFEYANTSDYYTTISLLEDLILPAAQVYFIFCFIVIDFENKNIRCEVGLNNEGKKAIETALPSVIESSILIKQTNREINKAVVIDKNTMTSSSDGTATTYYMHSDGSFDTNGNVDRLVPVRTDFELYSNVSTNATNLAKSGYQSKLDIFKTYAHLNRRLTDTEYDSLVGAVYVIMPLLFRSNTLTINIINDTAHHEFEEDEDHGLHSVITITNKSGNTYVYEMYQNVAGYKDIGYWEKDGSYVYMVTHIALKLAVSETNGGLTGTYTCYQDVTDANASAAINYMYTTNEFTQLVNMMQSRLVDMYKHQLAIKAFTKSKYQNLIEFSLLPDDPILEPTELREGQVVEVIHEGASYNSILTGWKIARGLIRLTFGTIRLELTKIIKGANK